MFFSVNEEIRIFLYACIMGVFYGIVYDAFRVIRASLPHNNVIVFFEDLIYMLFCALCYFVFIMELARGQLRLYILVGNLLGFSLEHYTVGNLCVKILRTIATFIRNWIIKPIYKYTIGIFLCAICRIFKGIYSKIRLKCTTLKKSKKSRKKALKVDDRVVYNKNV